MALGEFGSTLNDELNRLANGGTYRDKSAMVDEALAAKQWANRENIIPYSTDTVGILNEIAGLGLDKRNWLDFNGVCNYIAGTTGLPAAAALRQVYPTTDLLTGVASYYVDAYAGNNYVPTTASGYLYLPGVNGNYASAPDSSALDITGDIDIRAKIAPGTWFPAAQYTVAAKYVSSGNQRAYSLQINGGLLRFQVSNNGSAVTTIDSTAAVPFLFNQTGWVRVTFDVDNGASGNDTKFFTSNDGVTWTQLGTTITGVGTTSIFNSSAAFEIGSRLVGTDTVFIGSIYRVQVRSGIDGTIAFDANFETAMTSQTVGSFTESSTNAATVTVNRTTYNFQLDTINNLGAAGSLLPTTVGSSTAADSNDPKFLDHTGTNYVYLPGVNGNYLSVPDAAALDITGDIDVRGYIAADSWTPTSNVIIAKEQTTSTRSFRFTYQSDGKLYFTWSADGSAIIITASTVATGLAAGTAKWVRATLDVDNGAGGYDIKFYTSDNGTSWTQLGTTQTGGSTTSIFSGSSQVEIGSRLAGTADLQTGKIYRAQVLDGIDGTKVLDVDTSVITAGSATSLTAVTGQTVTINRSTSGRKTVAVTQPTWLFGTDDYMEVNNRYMASGTYLYLPGIAGNYASTPDAGALDITGDIDLRCKVALDDWTPGSLSTLVGKYGASGQRSYLLYVNTTGTLGFQSTADGSTAIISTSTIAPTVVDGATLWVRATLDVDNGASGNTVTFYTSTDGTNWTQLGDPVVNAGTTSIFNSTALLGVGAYATSGATSPARGKFFRAQVLNGIGGTVAFDANFETSITSLLQTSFTESSTNAATVTINRSGSTYRSAGITAAGYLYPGATNTFSASATSFLDFGASQSYTLLAVGRQHANLAFGPAIFKRLNTSTNPGYGIYFNTSNTQFINSNGSLNFNVNGPVATASALTTLTGIMDAGNSRATAYTNTTAGTSVSGTTLDVTNINPLRIGATAAGQYMDAEIYAIAVFRSALTVSQIRQVYNYFANREVYL